MPKYVVFFIAANRPQASEAKDDDDIKNDPYFKKTMQEFLNWIKAEIESERIKDGNFLLDASEETNIRVDFHTPEAAQDETEDQPTIPPPSSSLTRGYQNDMSSNMLGYYTAEFPALEDVIAWAQSCPISYDGFSLEIRQLQNNEKVVAEAEPEVKEWVGDQILSTRKKMLDQGKMKKEDDGTLWGKVEDDKEIKEIVADAEKRDAQNQSGTAGE